MIEVLIGVYVLVLILFVVVGARKLRELVSINNDPIEPYLFSEDPGILERSDLNNPDKE